MGNLQTFFYAYLKLHFKLLKISAEGESYYSASLRRDFYLIVTEILSGCSWRCCVNHCTPRYQLLFLPYEIQCILRFACTRALEARSLETKHRKCLAIPKTLRKKENCFTGSDKILLCSVFTE